MKTPQAIIAETRPKVPNTFDDIKTDATKTDEEFRNYDEATSLPRVVEHYRDMRSHQTVAFYRRMEQKYDFTNGNFRKLMTMDEAFLELENYVDGYSPKGKQWALGGDTFVVGCQIPDDAVVFPQFNHLNPDMHDDRYNTPNGMYEAHCGLDQLCFAWGHDEYMYRMLVANNTTIPNEGLDMIRYHSAYPMHDKGAYRHLLQDKDEERLDWVRLFNRFDLYTKDGGNDIRNEMDTLWPYYVDLLNKYGLGGKLKW